MNFLILKCHLAAKKLQFTGPPPKKKIRPHDHIYFSQPNQPNWPWDVIKPKVDFFPPFATWDPKRPANMRPNAFSSAIQMPLGRHWHGRIVVFKILWGKKWYFDREIVWYANIMQHVLMCWVNLVILLHLHCYIILNQHVTCWKSFSLIRFISSFTPKVENPILAD